jgi:hypothetical protein
VGIEHANAKLGWKTCDDKKKTVPQHLATADDNKHAFDVHKKLLDSKQREKPVYMEILNLVCVVLVLSYL